MLTICVAQPEGLRLEVVRELPQLNGQVLWVDLFEPSENERRWVSERYGVELPDEDEVDEIEASARFVNQPAGVQIQSYFFIDSAQAARNASIALILTESQLITLRYDEAAPVRLLARQIRAGRFTGSQPLDFLIALLEIKVDQLADVLERLYRHIRGLSERIFDPEPSNLETMVLELGSNQDLVDKVRLVLLDQERAMAFLLRNRRPDAAPRMQLRAIVDDLRSLKDHARFMFEKLDFLMDATHGRITTEQNRIIKIFSIAAVVFLPPTLVASIYGMNFTLMPELGWAWGYPLALLCMLVSAIAPYVFFRLKGWL